MKKAEAVQLIKKAITTTEGVNEKIQAEYDFLMEEYETDPKNVTAEDLVSLMTKLKKEGIVKSKKENKEVEEPKNEGEEEMAKVNKTVGKTTPKNQNTTTGRNNRKKKVENNVKKAPKVKMLKMTEIEEGYEFKPFPKTIKNQLGTLKLVDDIETMEDLAEAFAEEEERTLYIANVWVPDMLKDYDYDPMEILDEEEYEKLDSEGFVDDLDLLEITFATEKVVYAVSLYTEVHTTYTQAGFEVDEDGLRNNGFVNYQIYKLQ